MSKKENQHCGFVAIVGRPNVGKSTLLNTLLGKKVSITSCKPQTTKCRIIGIHTKGDYQIIYIDTPGLYFEKKCSINRLLNQSVNSAIRDVELIIFVVEGTHWTVDDEMVMNKLSHMNCPVLLIINKIDKVTNKAQLLLPYIDFINKKLQVRKINCIGIVPIIAQAPKKKQHKKEVKNNINIISDIVRKHMPKSEHHFPQDYITDRSKSFMASEIIREKFMRFLGEELPNSVQVALESCIPFSFGRGYNIKSLILVERDSQKKIVIGNKGCKIKEIGTEARKEMETIFSCKIHLSLWVKVKSGYTTNDKYS